MEYEVLNEELLHDGFLKIRKAIISHDRFSNDKPLECERELVDKGDFAAVLIYERDTDQLLFIKQFRYPTVKYGDGWILEIPAGGIEEGEDPVECAIREVEEETGYKISSDLKHITTCYSTPGGSTERMLLYYAEVSENDQVTKGGGLQDEGEDIQLCKYPTSEIDRLLCTEIVDSKTIIALQWFKLNNLKQK
ncbi:NUDIX hydrolase [Aquimarina sp. AD10]|uniref:GDP-mannose pyrophosphatase n=1 Tax=Aquimarina aggregata TaxID=1642818 RepID=A0A163CCB2_9FLAO|nr:MULTISPECIES: NUDIX hydrolase [Aquimarina]AXT59746.1 NUDIX hydrolase [Aquimarina sp. AD10]KZS42266.1 hypothetical protein AWE51_02155 [Aquimarina aggregata]RKM93504.1 NUDIX hydrolase [Aquimarina sp. AD10]